MQVFCKEYIIVVAQRILSVLRNAKQLIYSDFYVKMLIIAKSTPNDKLILKIKLTMVE